MTAHIFSITSTGKYLVKIISNDSSYFIEVNNEQAAFINLADATVAAKKVGCTEGFLCLENTYNECCYDGKQSRHAMTKVF